MVSTSILILGAGDYMGSSVSREFLKQKHSFGRVAILADASKVSKFDGIKADGMEIVVGGLTDAKSYINFNIVISLLGNHILPLRIRFRPLPEHLPNQPLFPGQTTNPRPPRQHHTVKSNADFNYALIIVGGFMEFVTEKLFGVDIDKHTFAFYGSPEARVPLTSVVDVAKIVVASTSLPKSTEQVREYRAPTGVSSWGEIIEIIEKAHGVSYECTYHSTEEARALQAGFAAEGDVERELAFSLKSAMGDPMHDGVPKPWDGEVFRWERVSLKTVVENLLSTAS